ncbi:MAG: 30S ribosomal protein S6 [Pseudomonadota bacterium]
MRHYETIYIINPNLPDEDYTGIIKKFNELIEKQQGVIIKVDEWGRQRMAYVVRKFDKGCFVLVNFCCDSKITAELERALKLDDRILLYQTVKLADDVNPEELLAKEEAKKKAPVAEEVGPENGVTAEPEEKKETGEVGHGISEE